MNWATFHFSCRFLSIKLSDGVELLSARKMLFEKYDKQLSNSPLENDIYKRIVSHSNPSKQQTLFSIYGNLNLDWDSSSISKLSNIRNYLFLLFAIFLILSGICITFVLPTFREIISLMDVPALKSIENFYTYWLISLLLMTIVSIGVMRLNSLVTQISLNSFSFNPPLIDKLLLTTNVTKQVQKIKALIYAPFGEDLNEFSHESNIFVTNLISDHFDISLELQKIINVENKKLTTLINARISKLMILLSTVVVTAIFNFIYSLYAPLFYIGNI